jgi:hypothetical protein
MSMLKCTDVRSRHAALQSILIFDLVRCNCLVILYSVLAEVVAGIVLEFISYRSC